MRPKQFAKLTFSLLKHPIYTGYALSFRSNRTTRNIHECIISGANWLLKAQKRSPDGKGYSRRFSLIKGWDRGYIETTGYIIPTLFDVSLFLGEPQYRESAIRAGYWLLTVQTEEGAFTDIDAYRPQVFDTGQVLLGLNRMFRETGDRRFLDSTRKAGRWLVDIQESDGSWRRFAYNDRPHAYYTRVAAALIETGQLAGIDEFIKAGQRNLNWVLTQEQVNGYFGYSEFRPGEDAILHTLVYVLEGFVMSFDLTQEKCWAEAAIRGATALKQIVNKQGLLFSQYNKHWRATNREYCVTGLAQYAGICFDIFRINLDREFLQVGITMLDHVCRWQMTRGDDIAGALPSSIPVWGYYGGMEFFNWNIKFFLDAALKNLGAPVGHRTQPSSI